MQVKKRSRGKGSTSFYLAIFNFIKDGKSPFAISKQLNISKQKVHYYTKILKERGFIDKHSNGNWFVKVKDFSLGTRPTTNLHALQIHIPILSGSINADDWEIKEELKNWTPKYKKLGILGGLTLKNNNNKSVSIFVHSRDLNDLKEIDALAFDVRNWAVEFFKKEYSVILDLFAAEVKSLHIATSDQNSEGMNSKGERFELDLDKKAAKVFPKDKINAKAWIDPTPFSFTAETNDKDWKKAYLSAPFAIQEIREISGYIAKNYASHIGVVEKLNLLLDSPIVKKHIKQKIDSKGQTKISDFK